MACGPASNWRLLRISLQHRLSFLCRGGRFIPCLPRSPSWHQECNAHCMSSLTGVPCVLVMCNRRHPIYLSAHPPILHCTVHGRGLDATPMPNANNLVARRSAHAPSWSPGRVPRFGFPSIMQPPIRVVSQGFPSLRRERQPWWHLWHLITAGLRRAAVGGKANPTNERAWVVVARPKIVRLHGHGQGTWVWRLAASAFFLPQSRLGCRRCHCRRRVWCFDGRAGVRRSLFAPPRQPSQAQCQAF